MKGLRYVTMLKNSWSLVTFVGAGRACTASTFSRSGCTPLASYRQPTKFMAGAFTCIFSGLNTTPYLRATCMRLLQTGIMFCLSVTIYGDVISAILIHLGHSSRNWSIFFWKMSCEQTRPKGKMQETIPPKGAVEGS